MTMVLESLPAGSPTDSLQTVSTNISNLAKKTDELSLTVNNNTGQIFNTMDMVADMKSQEVACRQDVIEHKVRVHNLNQLANFRDLNFKDRLELVTSTIANILHNNRGFDVELITPRPNSKFFESLAIVTFPTPGHKYNFEKRISNCRRENPSFKLSCSRPKLGLNKSDHFKSEEDMKT